MKKNFIIAGLLVAGLYNAQQDGSVGINAEPKGATLHVTIAAGAAAADGQGVAVPNVTKDRLNQMTGTIATSALVYVTDASALDGSTTTKVKEVGYHYFDGTEWVKLGGGASTSTSTTNSNVIHSIKSTNVTGEVATLNTLKSTDWKEGDYTFVLQMGFTGSVELPDPTQNKGRVIALRNVSGANRNFSPYTPVNNATINTNRGLVLHSDGDKWHAIGGF